MDTHCDILQLASYKGGRRWPDDLKAQIVAETLLPGARVRDLTRAYGIRANRISEWRTLAKKGVLVLPSVSADRLPQFAPLVIEKSAYRCLAHFSTHQQFCLIRNCN